MNPFEYTSPLAPSDLIDRDRETETLVDRAADGHNSRLVAPRRYGKTSVLNRVRDDVDREGFTCVYVNFFGVLTAGDVAQRIELAYSRQLTGRLAAWFSAARRGLSPSVGAHAGIGVVGVNAQVKLDAASQQSVLERLAIPRRLHEQRGTRCLVVFDEFQDVLTASNQMDAVIRSEIEQHRDAASYIFAGSHVGMMRELFTSQRRAFYGQAGVVELEPLDPQDIAEYLYDRFAAGNRELTGGLDALLDVGAGHPQRTMLLAHFLWEQTAAGGAADEEAFARAVDHVMTAEVADEMRAIWTKAPAGQKRVFAAVADDVAGLYATTTQERVGGSRGAAMQQAAHGLVDSGDLVKDGRTHTGYRLVDPLLARWVRARAGAT
ncbi:MAG: AAA family ATPase [Solirubrobacteraceae bacterium]